MSDLHNNIKASRALSPAAAITDNTAQVSEILDTANFESNELLVIYGSIADADATFTVLLEDGDNSSLTDAASVADANLLGTESGAAPLFSDDNKVFKLGYKGSKRYIRATITPAANTGNLFMAAIWVQSAGRIPPYTTQGV
ncbi:MAG: hypothetical protein A3F84_27720 [Candidatus Handelsmanbacteria bacterium RIFCSPLOWO2_12_FULL_64_10]|uniref:PLAT domain-containing protein n=1 Tax=Handelsmanbacteria sp. (strain RIFCSPLOWO2_12_FULL_64_10) TaxID=1817868 RepID=A0A1F6C4L0_HANXR|nr:MAG: hypothetical protein A3F84_27720 [Candidatus Handelsmanbacteria bacterium RIFCSPLOWO2_12_FULL_64_10]